MYDIRQFKPALYALILIGITGFATATGSPGVWVLAMLAVGINAWLVYSNRFRPVPRLLANAVTVAAGIWAVLQVTDGEAPVVPIGLFLIVLQVVKFYEQRGNRDYGQLIVLSLLTMVAASMTIGGTAFAFGLLFLAWIFVSLYASLLFHLKVETDSARRVMRLDDDRPGEVRRLRQDQRRLGSSMRRLTAAVALCATACAVIVFLVFPRGQGASFFGMPTFSADQAVTGFSGSVNFQDIARIQQNTDPVAYMSVLRNGKPIRGTQTLYLRGNTLDTYVSDPSAPDRWTWKRSVGLERRREIAVAEGQTTPVPVRGPLLGDLIEQRVELEPTGVDTVFALAGVVAYRPDTPQPHDARILWYPADGSVTLGGRRVTRRKAYTIWSTGEITPPALLPDVAFDSHSEEAADYGGLVWPAGQLAVVRDRVEAMRLATLARENGDTTAPRLDPSRTEIRSSWMFGRFGMTTPDDGGFSLSTSPDYATDATLERAQATPVFMPSDAIIDFALDPAISGVDAQGRSLAQQRIQMAGTTALDAVIAENIERNLRTQYRYTLDVSQAAARLAPDADPLGWFVGEEGRMGHCEFFAGTMALACQSLGIPARVVVGFKSSEYNANIDRYTVRQSDAHAWVEVLTTAGWQRYDPTSNTPADEARRSPTGWDSFRQQVRHVTEFLEYAWANHVVGYDRGRQEDMRETLIEELDRSVTSGAVNAVNENSGLISTVTGWLKRNTMGRIGDLKAWLEGQNLYGLSANLAAALLILLPLVGIALIVAYIFDHWRLDRRAQRIGLDSLPSGQARRLARQLGFYDELVRLLERRGLARAPQQTPREFARSLSFLPPAAYTVVDRLTEAYYRIRYGHAPVSAADRHELDLALQEVAQTLRR